MKSYGIGVEDLLCMQQAFISFVGCMLCIYFNRCINVTGTHPSAG